MGKGSKELEGKEKHGRRNFLIVGGIATAVGIYVLVTKDDPSGPSYRQSKLERMIEDKRIAWMYDRHVESITYDPGLNAQLSYIQKELEQAQRNENISEIQRLEKAINTNKRYAQMNAQAAAKHDEELYAIIGKGHNERNNAPEKKSAVFVTERFFDTPKEYTDEDRKCILYHEGLHSIDSAGLTRKGRAKWVELLRKKMGRQTAPPEVLNDRELSNAIHEFIVYHDELVEINKGTFKVSEAYRADVQLAYNKHYACLQHHAQYDNVKGWNAQTILKMAFEPVKE